MESYSADIEMLMFGWNSLYDHKDTMSRQLHQNVI
jgi:hypothetical protein